MTFTHRPHVSLTWFTFCFLHHSWLLMTAQLPDSCDVSTWKMISNSLDIDFIHSDIHGRSCNKMGFQSWLKTLRSEQNGRHFADVFKCIWYKFWHLTLLFLFQRTEGHVRAVHANDPEILCICCGHCADEPDAQHELAVQHRIQCQVSITPSMMSHYYRKTSSISRTFVGNETVDNSDVVGASPVGAAPTTSSFST